MILNHGSLNEPVFLLVIKANKQGRKEGSCDIHTGNLFVEVWKQLDKYYLKRKIPKYLNIGTKVIVIFIMPICLWKCGNN